MRRYDMVSGVTTRLEQALFARNKKSQGDRMIHALATWQLVDSPAGEVNGQ